ncbi:hypothetical protein ACTXT7_006429 [Hymenolepis weldensis]
MSKRFHRFPPFSITASFHLKSTSAFMFSLVLTPVLIYSSLRFPIENNACWLVTGAYASCLSLLYLSLSLTRFNPRCVFLEYIFGLINSRTPLSMREIMQDETSSDVGNL